jgi:hypothetical protein
MMFAGRTCLSGGGVMLRFGRLVAALWAAWRLEVAGTTISSYHHE